MSRFEGFSIGKLTLALRPQTVQVFRQWLAPKAYLGANQFNDQNLRAAIANAGNRVGNPYHNGLGFQTSDARFRKPGLDQLRAALNPSGQESEDINLMNQAAQIQGVAEPFRLPFPNINTVWSGTVRDQIKDILRADRLWRNYPWPGDAGISKLAWLDVLDLRAKEAIERRPKLSDQEIFDVISAGWIDSGEKIAVRIERRAKKRAKKTAIKLGTFSIFASVTGSIFATGVGGGVTGGLLKQGIKQLSKQLVKSEIGKLKDKIMQFAGEQPAFSAEIGGFLDRLAKDAQEISPVVADTPSPKAPAAVTPSASGSGGIIDTLCDFFSKLVRGMP